MSDLISRQAAIDAIQKLNIPEDMCVFEIMSHIEVEIATLPSAQPEPKPDKNGSEPFGNAEMLGDRTTDDCISRQAAIDAAMEELDGGTPYDIPNKIMALPSTQPEIIACGDCKHWICHGRRCGYWNHGVRAIDWCCHAERRTDE